MVFEVSDGQVLSFRGLVTKRSAYMSAMLCGNFDETLKLTVVIPDIEVDILRLCLYYLYIDQCPATKDVYEAMEVLVAADRFCMPRLIDLIQDHIITTYLSLSVGNDDCVVATKALELLEVAEVLCSFIGTISFIISNQSPTYLFRLFMQDTFTAGAVTLSPHITPLSTDIFYSSCEL